MPGVITILIGLAIFAVVALAVIYVKLLHICPPNEVLVVSGAASHPEGRERGYKIVRGGKRMIWPLFERVDRLDLTNMAIEVTVKGAYTKGGIPANVSGVANCKIPGQGPVLFNAIERFVGKSREEIRKIAKETLEGNLRGVMASLTPEELNEDKIKFAERLVDEAEEDLGRLGLVLDTLKIQNVWDDVSYLDSIGRIRNSEIQRNAAIAEAEAHALSAVRDASNRRETEIARIEAARAALQAQIAKEMTDAETMREVLVEREKGDVAALVAQAKADALVQKARVEQVERRLQADIVEPARAKMNQQIATARGAAADVLEQGRASAEALREIASTWKQGGARARDAFLFQKIGSLMKLHTGTVSKLRVDRLTILPPPTAGEGAGGTSTAHKLVKLNEEVKAALGIDLARLVEQKLSGGGAPSEDAQA
jgi:flotillin